MTEIITVETTCDNCGTSIAEFSSRWKADFDHRHDPDAPDDEYDWRSAPEGLHICMECAQSVLGDLLRNVANRRGRP